MSPFNSLSRLDFNIFNIKTHYNNTTTTYYSYITYFITSFLVNVFYSVCMMYVYPFNNNFISASLLSFKSENEMNGINLLILLKITKYLLSIQ